MSSCDVSREIYGAVSQKAIQGRNELEGDPLIRHQLYGSARSHSQEFPGQQEWSAHEVSQPPVMFMEAVPERASVKGRVSVPQELCERVAPYFFGSPRN